MKVVVTGSGVLSSLGNDPDSVFTALQENRTGVRLMPDWKQYNGLHAYLAAPTLPYDEKTIPRAARRTMSRMSEMATIATAQALRQADLRPAGRRCLLVLGSTTGSPDMLEAYFRKLFERGGPEGQMGTSFFKIMNHTTASNVAMALELAFPVFSSSSACTTSSQAMALGWELLQSGLYDVVIAGGADELHYNASSVFDIVGAASRGYHDMPERAPRPFDRDRDGLAVAEGAAVVVMETEAHAAARGARPLAEVAGAAHHCDGRHMAQPQAEAMAEAMRMALDRAGLQPSDIDYVNAHATATRLGDIEEAKATASVFGERVPVSSLKGHFGHTLAACGTLEVIAGIEMMRHGVLIPTRNLENPDPDCGGVNLLREKKYGPVRSFVSNNFAFGGMSTSLVILSR